MVLLFSLILSAQAYIVGDNDIQKIKDLPHGSPIIQASKPVGKITGKDLLGFKNYCTGFLISETEFITAFSCKKIARDFLKITVEFNYYDTAVEKEEFSVDKILYENEMENVVVLQLKGEPGKKHGFYEISSNHTNKTLLIHHSAGDVKQVSDNDCKIHERKQNLIMHTCDTELSSSGSPLLNEKFEAIGLHIGALSFGHQTVNYAMDLSQISY
jgi:V8-like Glu-specific endopeptidase